MLKKLMKYEWQGIYKVGCILTLVIIAVTAIGCIMLQLPAMADLFSEKSNLNSMQIVGWTIMGFVSLMLYIFMLIGATYGMFIFMGVRFYRTMYTDQGYLTNTLPVTTHQMLLSKILVSGIWYLLIELVVLFSVFALVAALLNGLLSEQLAADGYKNLWEALAAMRSDIGMLWEEMGFSMLHYGISFLLTFLIGPFASIAILFGAVTLGQLSKKHRGIMGVLAYLGTLFLKMIISTIVQFVNTFQFSYEIASNTNSSVSINMAGTYDASLITVVVMAVVLYWAAHYILTRKLNMD